MKRGMARAWRLNDRDLIILGIKRGAMNQIFSQATHFALFSPALWLSGS